MRIEICLFHYLKSDEDTRLALESTRYGYRKPYPLRSGIRAVDSIH